MERKHLITIYSLLALVALLLLYLVFRQPIDKFIKTKSILSRASIYKTTSWLEYVDDCFKYKTIPEDQCTQIAEIMEIQKESLKNAVLKKSDYDCEDFLGESRGYVEIFYEYLGGPEYDPYELDSDKDGVPCEEFNYD